jgi:hypothetical protein
LVVVDSYLFPEELIIGNQSAAASGPPGHTAESLVTITAADVGSTRNATFLENVNQVLSYLKSGVRVFQQLLGSSNVSQILKDGKM